MKGAAAVLANIVGEMERRYELLGAARARNLPEFNRARREGEPHAALHARASSTSSPT